MLGWVRVIVLYVGLGRGYSLIGWVGHGVIILWVQYQFSMGMSWVRVEICGFGLGVGYSFVC